MSEPTISLFSLYALAYRGDQDLLSGVIDQMEEVDLKMSLHMVLMSAANEIPEEDRAHAAQVASAYAAQVGEQS